MVCKSNSLKSFFHTFSPAPPSNKTLSGKITAALPPIFKRLIMCYKKFSYLFEVLAKKSSLV
ncbi:hypothetical protein HFN_2110 [Helicobacter fennelliae MRY12-0050]|uniref:Uncharacterized protein n=1 Tax=Helicobacter fennelliae MRY12-0050 TaxID=1325130 RepID=T1DVF1_9HELI|nr:hypothetical protein HFN_2110 [Helicobacter fennelliae MRY12-0050]